MNMNILIADDSIGYRLFIKEILKNIGHSCICVKNGKEAIQTLKKKQDIDIVFMDIEMPVLNGIDATKAIKQNIALKCADTPVIALSSHNKDYFVEHLQIFGFDDFLPKNCTPGEIKNILENFQQ